MGKKAIDLFNEIVLSPFFTLGKSQMEIFSFHLFEKVAQTERRYILQEGYNGSRG